MKNVTVSLALHLMNKREKELFFVKMAKTERFKQSAIKSMQKLYLKLGWWPM